MIIAGREFRPSLWAWLAGLLAVGVLVGLGSWQLQRLTWKNELMAERVALLEAPPVSPPAPNGDLESLEFRTVTLAGRFLHEKELYLAARPYKKRVGLHVVTPLLLEDGRAIFVDRGWIPPDHQDPLTRQEGLVAGPIEMNGVLRQGGWKGRDLFRPENDPKANLWLWLDLPAMAAAAGLDHAITSVYVQAGDQPSGAYPVARPYKVDLRNDHLQYALTWFSLALILVIVFVIFHLKRPLDKTPNTSSRS